MPKSSSLSAGTQCRDSDIPDPARPASTGHSGPGQNDQQCSCGYTGRSKFEAAISRCKRIIGGTLRSRRNIQRATEVAIVIKVLNHMRQLGQAITVRVASAPMDGRFGVPKNSPCTKAGLSSK